MHIASGARLAHGKRHELGEGPVFNEADGNFYYVDIDGQELCRYDPNTRTLLTWPANEKVCGVAVNRDSSLLVVRQSGIYYFRPDEPSAGGERWLKIAEVEPDRPENRPNDLAAVKCSDGRTRLFLGTMPLNKEPLPDGGPGALYVLSDTLELQKLVPIMDSGAAISLVTTNGLAGFARAGEDTTTLFFSDSHRTAQKIYRAEYDPRTNSLRGVQEFLDMSAMPGRPDGGGLLSVMMSDGRMKLCYGITALDTNLIAVYDPDTRRQVARIDLPEGLSKPTKFASGTTKDGHDVCLVTSLDPKNGQPLAGHAFLCDLPETIRAVPSVLCDYPSFEEMAALFLRQDWRMESPKDFHTPKP
jgi:sugar lactone lactonase YvrE